MLKVGCQAESSVAAQRQVVVMRAEPGMEEREGGSLGRRIHVLGKLVKQSGTELLRDVSHASLKFLKFLTLRIPLSFSERT